MLIMHAYDRRKASAKERRERLEEKKRLEEAAQRVIIAFQRLHIWITQANRCHRGLPDVRKEASKNEETSWT